MPDLLTTFPLIFAEAAAAPAASSNPLSTLLPLLPIPVLFYLLMIRPQQQQEKKRRAMIDAMKKNDRVLTSAGIYGTVISVDPEKDKVVLRVDDDKGIKLEFSKTSVVRVIDAAAEKGETT